CRDEVYMSCAMRPVRGNRGQTLVEFGVCAVVAMMTLLAVVEFGRMVLVYTTVCNATRVGVRFAMVRGVHNPPASTDVQTIVNSYLSAAAIDTSSATVTTTYPGYAGAACASGSTGSGCPVKVVVSYVYQPMLSYYNFHVTLSSQSEGVITF